MKYPLLICDDDRLQAKALADLAEASRLPLSIEIFDNPEDLKDRLEEQACPSILMLDIVLNDKTDGIDLAQSLSLNFPGNAVIFVSGQLEKACDVYEAEHCYFVYKPQKETTLPKALRAAIHELEKRPATLILHEGRQSFRILPEDIMCIDRTRRTTMITLKDQVIQVRETLNELKERLPEYFGQSHRNYLVNFNSVQRLYPDSLRLVNGLTVPVSRRMGAEFRKSFDAWLAAEENVL